jgi:hypothetical protein
MCAATCSTAFSSPAHPGHAGPGPVHRVLPARHLALTWAGWIFANESLAIREQTFNAGPAAAVSLQVRDPAGRRRLLLQGMVEIVRCVICIRDGEWPSREQDVEEVDVDKLKEMVHVKDEDIAALDKFVVAQEPPIGKSTGRRNEDPQGTVVRLHPDGADHARHRDAAALRNHHQRPPRPADALAGGGGHHARLSHGLHADGHGHDLRLARLPQRQPGHRRAPDAGPDGAARLR